MWEIIVSKLLGSFSETAADVYLQKKKLKHEVEMERLRGKVVWEQALTQRASESEGRDHEWELARIKDSGLKDEWVLGLLSIPLIGSFHPSTQEGVLQGFETLAKTPLWYQGMVVTIFLAIYGIRKWRRDIKPVAYVERPKD